MRVLRALASAFPGKYGSRECYALGVRGAARYSRNGLKSSFLSASVRTHASMTTANTSLSTGSIYQPPSSLLKETAQPASYKFRINVDGDTTNSSSSPFHLEGEGEGEHTGKRIRIPGVWLRDHCGCSECVHSETQQRMFDIFAPSMRSHQIASYTSDNNSISIEWTDGHRSQYKYETLARSWSPETILDDRQGRVPMSFWDRSIVDAPPEVRFSSIMESETGLAECLHKVREHGFCLVPEVPATTRATELLLERIGPIRNTHYGAFWECTADMSKADTAYTSLALDVHNDSTYFSDPVGVMLFHLLEHSGGSGGASQFVDGFGAAHALWEQDRAAYEVLAETKMLAHSSGNEGISIQPQTAFSVLEHDPDTRLLRRIRWNNSDRCTFIPSDAAAGHNVEKWYAAAAKLVALLRSTRAQYEFQMQPGKPVIFDNWRVLHGRSAFTGKRTLCGGYINMDDFISRYRTSYFGHETVLRHGVY